MLKTYDAAQCEKTQIKKESKKIERAINNYTNKIACMIDKQRKITKRIKYDHSQQINTYLKHAHKHIF